jgi:hypothetical protein
MKIEDVERIMEDTREAIAYQNVRFHILFLFLNPQMYTDNSFSSLLSETFSFQSQEISELLGTQITEADEEEIERELADLMSAEPIAFPDVPTHTPTLTEEERTRLKEMERANEAGGGGERGMWPSREREGGRCFLTKSFAICLISLTVALSA